MNQWLSRAFARNRNLQWTLAGTLVMLTLCLLTGCIVLPVPVNYHTQGSRKNLKPEDAQGLSPGVTTRHEAILRLGEPDQVTEDETQLAYRWEKVYLQVWWAVGGEYSGTGGRCDFGRDYTLELTFDRNGTLTNCEVRDSGLENKGTHSL